MEKKEIQVDSSEINGVNTVATDQLAGVHIAATWPTEPKPLVPSKKEQLIWAAYDTVLIILPVGLIVKTGLVILAHHLDQNNTGSYFDQATSLSRYLVSLNAQLVTLFTIVFVTIMSTFVKRYALWKAQEGAYLSDLEQLQGSVSLPSTLKLIVSLGSYSTMSALLVLVWTFYYLGSQAAKDEYAVTNSDSFKDRYAIVQRPDAPTSFTPGIQDIIGTSSTGNYSEWQKETTSNIRDFNYQLAGAILEAKKAGAQGNYPTLGSNQGALIPDLDSVISAYAPDGLTDKIVQRVTGYIDVSHQQKNQEIYANLEGVMPVIVDWNPKGGDDQSSSWYTQQILGSYTLSTSYLSVACSDFQAFPLDAFPNGTSYNSSFSLNMTSYRSDAPRDSAGHPLREFEYWYRASLTSGLTITHAPGGGIVVTGDGQTDYYAMKGICNVTAKNIDLGVSCVTTGCFPHRMRWRNNTNETMATSYSTQFDSEEFGNAFLSNLSLSTGPVNDWENDRPLILDYLTPTLREYDPSDPDSRPASVYPLQITKLFNTYLIISQKFLSDKYFGTNIPTIMKEGSDAMSQRMTVKGAPFDRGYRINWAWIPIDFIASTILLAAAIASWRLRLMTLAPDIFGYVSSMTRENNHVSLPTEGSMLSGMDRARMLKRVKVKIGEVTTEAPDGQGSTTVVSLAPVDTGVSGLQRERLYY